MGLRSNGFYATVWGVNAGKGNWLDVQLSTSKKDPKDNTKYITDWSGFARFVGAAKEVAAGLKKKDRIYIKEFEVTNNYVPDKRATYTNVTVFAAEIPGSNSGSRSATSSPSQDSYMSVPDGAEDGGLPFN